VLLALLFVAGPSGCAALTNPVLEGVPVRRLPPELLGPSKNETVTIPLTALEQPHPDVYRLDAGDVLGIYIEGVLGSERPRAGELPAPPPVHFPESIRQNPTFGYPIAVRPDGTLALPLVRPIPVRGLSVAEAQDAITRAYVQAEVLRPGRERVLVDLARARTFRVMVFRQEIGGFSSGPEGVTGIALAGAQTKRGSGHVVDLPAYENDVLHALSETGGLPGLDACNEVVVMRSPSDRDRQAVEAELQKDNHAHLEAALAGVSCPVIKIPLRVKPGTVPPPRLEDVLLHTGDVVFIEARELDRFYTGGLLPAGEYPLPRDRDLDVVQAVAMLRGPLVSGGFGIAGGGEAISNDTSVIAGGPNVFPVVPVPPLAFGSPSPSLLTIIRRTPCGGVVPIRVDLNKAMRDPRERILVKAQDVLILQETPGEAVARYLSQQINFRFVFNLFQSSTGTGTATGTFLNGSASP
jgi:hypothetical protein